MTAMTKLAQQPIPVPARMAHLDRDRLGRPIPVNVMRNDDGSPLFAVNDGNTTQRLFREDRCEICGGKLLRGRWFTGGQLSACAEHGYFMDAPMHDECVHYALQVCPYLAAPNYGRLVGDAKHARSDRKAVLTLYDPTKSNPRPAIFIAVMAVAQETTGGHLFEGFTDPETEVIQHVRPKPGAVRRVEVWRHGEQIRDTGRLREVWAGVLAELAQKGMEMRLDILRLTEQFRR